MTEHGAVKLDPAIERFNRMREDAYKHYRFTRRTTRSFLWGVVIVPVSIFYLASKTDAQWYWPGTRKGEPLSRTARKADSE